MRSEESLRLGPIPAALPVRPAESSGSQQLERMGSLRRGRTGTRAYMRSLTRRLIISDFAAVSFSVLVAHIVRFGADRAEVNAQGIALLFNSLNYGAISILLILMWMLMLRLHGSYDPRLAGHGVEEYRQVATASAWLFGVVAIISYVFKLELARGYVALAFPLGTLLLLVGRWLWRKWLVRHRRAGRMSDQVVVVGEREHVAHLVRTLNRAPEAGYRIIGACVNDADGTKIAGVPVLGSEDQAAEVAVETRANVVACTSAQLGSTGLRRLGWALEGKDVDLVVAPGLTDVAGPRVLTRPVEGLPLLHVDSPRFTGPGLAIKTGADMVVSGLGMLLLAPVILAVAVLIKIDSRGPILFRQKRVGRDGREFTMWKFRTMVNDAEQQLRELRSEHDGAGPLFKLRDDPRVTRVGKVLRRYSLDEIPQLFNVLVGEMSLVGPRPPLASEVELYGEDVRRRLLVKPGMTGLWQINGRSDLAWDDAVRFDLYYVENWSMLMDAQIIWRTLRVVVMPAGAY